MDRTIAQMSREVFGQNTKVVMVNATQPFYAGLREYTLFMILLPYRQRRDTYIYMDVQ